MRCAEVSVTSPASEVRENLQARAHDGLRNPNAAVAASLGLRSLGVRIRVVLEIYHPEFCTFLLATLALIGSTEGSGLSGQVVLSARATSMQLLISQRFCRSGDTLPPET